MKNVRSVLFLAVLLISSIGNAEQAATVAEAVPARVTPGKPVESVLRRAGSVTFDVRNLPNIPPKKRFRFEREAPPANPVMLPGRIPEAAAPVGPGPLSAPAPAPIASFDGLDRVNWGQGFPPDTVGDVGPVYYIQSINSSVGIYRKSDGVQVAAFTLDTFMSQGSFGNICDTENFGDPVVLYDSFEDRWIITDFAFQVDGSGNVINPPGAYQCFAASKTGDPVSGGWNFYSVAISGGLDDYPKFGIWPDGLYMSANMFGYAAGSSFQGPRVYALNKAQMYAGSPTVQVVSFDAPTSDFTLLPSNARLQTGTPPTGTPNYFVSTWQFLNALTVYKLHVDWDRISLSTFTGPDAPLAATSWPNASVANAPSQGGNNLDVLQIRAMMQNQYSNIGGAESLWVTHTVRRGNTSGFAAPRWYQVDVTGGTVAANIPQATTFDPDGANVMHRFMPSLAVDRAGNMALGYSTSSSTTKPAIKYAGRLATDPANTMSLTEQVLIQGTGTQVGNCGGSTCTRWGDYAAMSLDPDGCTFWFTSEYYAADGLNYLTRIGSFAFAECTPVGAGGTVSGTVTATVGGAPISGATVKLGSRTATTDGSGNYSFSVPAGTYPSLTVTAAGYNPASATNIVVTDGNTTDQDFSLGAGATSGCLTDTSAADFQRGVPTNADLTTSAGDVVLYKPSLDQQSTTLGTSGVGITITTWGGQTFTPAVTGQLTKADINLFCSGCTGTTPNLTLSVRATSGGLPTGADLASGTITGFSSGSSAYYTATFSSPPTLTAGTMYALVIRPTANPSPGTYALTRSGTSTAGANVYANGTRVSGATSGTVWSIPLTGGISTDAGFRTYMDSGYGTPGNLVSGLFDTNPGPGKVPSWLTLSWTATTPANTTLQFQVAASNSPDGPFNFVGPDSTAGTFFTTSGASLSQFNGFRYLKYKAYLATTNNAVTPTLNDVTVCFVLGPPDLSLTKSDGGASVAPGGTVSYTLTYANAGTAGATGVVLTETVPTNSTFNAGASTAGWSCTPDNNAGSTCTLALGSVAASGGSSATFAVTVASPAGANLTQISNTASIADDGTHGTDPTPGNNSASDTTPVTGAPDLTISKSDGGASVTQGGTISYTLTYANTGNREAANTVLTETVPANTTFNPGSSTAGWSCTPSNAAGSTCTLTVGSLVGASGNQAATFVVTVDNPVPNGVTVILNTASIHDEGGAVGDPNPGDNSGSDSTPITDALAFADYYDVTPCRLLDTRLPGTGGALISGVQRVFSGTGICGVPADAVAIAISFTVINPSGAGYVTLFRGDATIPVAASITFRPGVLLSNNGIVPLALDATGTFGAQSLVGGGGGVHLAVDVMGYFK